MKIQRIDPMGGGQVHALGMKYVERDEVVDVPEDAAALLLIQTENWRLPDKAPKKDEDFLSKVLADHHRIGMDDEIAAGPHQFFQVLRPHLALVVLGLFVHGQQAAVMDDMPHPLGQRLVVGVVVQRLDQGEKTAHGAGSSPAQATVGQQLQRGLPQRLSTGAGCIAQ